MSTAEIGVCDFCRRSDTQVFRQYLHAKNKPKVGDGFAFIYYCHECELLEDVVIKDSPIIETRQNIFKRLAIPLMEFLYIHYNPHAKIIIDTTTAELFSGEMVVKSIEHIND